MPADSPTRPIIGIENRTAQEVFDIMSDRIRSALSASPAREGDLGASASPIPTEQAGGAVVTPDDWWIEWFGGKCPVARRTLVTVRRRDGREVCDMAFKFDWTNENYAGVNSDIVAYRVEAAPSTTSTAEQVGTSDEVAGLIEKAQEVAGRMGARLEVDPAKAAAFPAHSPGEGDAPVAWRANVLNTIAGTDAWELSHEEPKPRRGYRIREVQRLGILPDQTFPAEREVGRAIYERIEKLTADGAATPERAYLTELVESVEEVGGYDGPSRPTPATPAGEELREKFARIVDPHAFLSMEDAGDAMVSEMVSQSRKDAYRKADRLLAVARGEPDAILAALQPQAEGGGGHGRGER